VAQEEAELPLAVPGAHATHAVALPLLKDPALQGTQPIAATMAVVWEPAPQSLHRRCPEDPW
jgi:hypothetical protein